MKDYTIIKEQLKGKEEVTTKDILDLGYTRYDINKMIELNIITKLARGIYKCVEEIKKDTINEPSLESEHTEPIEQPLNYHREATYQFSKKNYAEALDLFKKALSENNTESYAYIGIISSLIYLDRFTEAKDMLLEYYYKREDDSILFSIYNILLLLSKLIDIDDEIIESVKKSVDTSETILKPKRGRFHSKFFNTIPKEDWPSALKYINKILRLDYEQRKYRISNQCFKKLIDDIIKKLDIEIEYYKTNSNAHIIESEIPDKENDSVSDSTIAQVEESVPVIVPKITIEEVAKRNLLLEAINNNEFDKALELLENVQIENPEEIIRTLISKLSLIKSLVTTNEKIKVVTTEEVRVVSEESLDETIIIPEEPIKIEALKVEDSVHNQQLEEASVHSPDISVDELINQVYAQYRESLEIDDFANAQIYLNRYQYLCNTNSRYRNIKYHYQRIAERKKAYNENPTLYLEKQKMLHQIIESRRTKNNDEALRLIKEYKELQGYVSPQIIILEAEINLELKHLDIAEKILSSLSSCEEPAYFMILAKIKMQKRYYKDALECLIAYNERRPNKNAAAYILMAECYQKIDRPVKALKCLKKADEINKMNNKNIDLSGKIARAEMKADIKTEQRLLRMNPNYQDYSE